MADGREPRQLLACDGKCGRLHPHRDVTPGVPGAEVPDQAAAAPAFRVGLEIIWLSAVALPKLLAGDMDPATEEVVFSCSLVVIVLAVTPWRYVWQQYSCEGGQVAMTGDLCFQSLRTRPS